MSGNDLSMTDPFGWPTLVVLALGPFFVAAFWISVFAAPWLLWRGVVRLFGERAGDWAMGMFFLLILVAAAGMSLDLAGRLLPFPGHW